MWRYNQEGPQLALVPWLLYPWFLLNIAPVPWPVGVLQSGEVSGYQTGWRLWLEWGIPLPHGPHPGMQNTGGNAAHPHQQQLQQPTVGPQHYLPDPRPKLTCMIAAQGMGQQEAATVPFLNPDPIAHLVGHSNEAPVIMDGQRPTALIDLDAKVSSISSWFSEDLTLQIQPLGRLFELEGTGGSAIPYLGYVEVNLQIPRIKNYNENILPLVIPTTTYSQQVLVMAGSKIMDWNMAAIYKRELVKVTTPGYCLQSTAVIVGYPIGTARCPYCYTREPACITTAA